ncbi:MAG: hypothetical protein HY924_06015 [Elusimicrobia bacterium]|nr:hypothetical protein [Elusimicrobiota bacterium]
MQGHGRILFSIPYNGDLGLVRWASLSGQVCEVYFGGWQGCDFSSAYVGLEPLRYAEVAALARFCRGQGIGTNLLLNKNPLFFDDIRRIFEGVRRLSRDAGLTCVTVSDPALVPLLRKEFPAIAVQSSIYMGVNSLVKARAAARLGVTSLCVDPEINRDFAALKDIAGLKAAFPRLRVKLLGVLRCYQGCPYAWRHADWGVLRGVLEAWSPRGWRETLGGRLDHDRCLFESDRGADEIRRPFIRPEDLGYYERHGLADVFKVAYREDSSERLKGVLTAYFDRRFDGNLFTLFSDEEVYAKGLVSCDNRLIPKGFVSRVMRCKGRCESCDYCASVAKRCVRAAPGSS